MSTIKRITTPFSYSAAVQAGDYVFLGLHRGFGDTFATQMEGAMNGIKGTLAQLDIPLDHLVKIQVWLKNINDLQEMEKIVHTYFEADTFPARMTSSTEFIDADCLVMLEGVAYKGD